MPSLSVVGNLSHGSSVGLLTLGTGLPSRLEAHSATHCMCICVCVIFKNEDGYKNSLETMIWGFS